MKFDRRRKTIIAMVHVGALPGTPAHRKPLAKIIRNAIAEAVIYERSGADAILIENMHDTPYLNGEVGPEIVAAMTAVGCGVRNAIRLPIGVQILAGANCAALATAHASGASFVRAENFAYAHVADEGLMPNAAAGPLLRYRRQIGGEGIMILADIKKKHSSHAITQDLSIKDVAEAASFFRADGVVVTGHATGQAAAISDLQVVRASTRLPVLVGSGTTPDNLAEHWPLADGFIVGSFFKRAGRWENAVDEDRVRRLMGTVAKLRR